MMSTNIHELKTDSKRSLLTGFTHSYSNDHSPFTTIVGNDIG